MELDNKPSKPLRERKAAQKAEPEETEPKAKAKGESKKKEPEPKWYNDGRLAKITGLGLLAFSFLMAVSFTSYLFTVADDQSEVMSGGISTLNDNTVHVHNALGRLGAWLAHLFINNLFGLPSYLFVLTSFVIGFNLLLQKKIFPAWKIAANSFLGMIWLSAAFAYLNNLVYPASIVSWGGAFGNYLTGETGYLTGLLKPIGTGALLIVTALVFAIVVYNISFSVLLKALDIFSRKNETVPAAVPMEMAVTSTIPEFRDAGENIFGKDNIAGLAEDIANGPLTLEMENTEEEPEVKIIDLDSGEEIKRGKKKRAEEEEGDLELEVEEAVEEAVAEEATGSLGTNFDPTLDLSGYKFPGLELLEEYGSDKVKIDSEELERNKNQIISTLNNYQIEISKIK